MITTVEETQLIKIQEATENSRLAEVLFLVLLRQADVAKGSISQVKLAERLAELIIRVFYDATGDIL